MNRIKAVIVEDEKFAVLNLKALLNEYAPDIHIVQVFASGKEALQKLPELEFDLLFLDIQFNDDFDAFEMLKAWQFEQLHIIFVSSYNQYALKAFKHNAIDFITKPIDKDDLIQAINKARMQVFRKDELDLLLHTIQAFRKRQIAIKSQNETLFLHPENILCFTAEKEYSIVSFIEKSNFNTPVLKEFITSKHLGFWEDELLEFPFIRIHKSFLVNMEHIQSFNTKHVNLSDGSQFEIARERRKAVQLKILSFKTEL